MATQQTRERGQSLLEKEIARRGGALDIVGKGRSERLLVQIPGRTVTARFSVKSKRDWLTRTTEGDPLAVDDESRMWVFVDIAEEESVHFYIAPEAVIRRDIFEKYEAYLTKHGGRRPKSPDSRNYAIRVEHIEQWLERWDLLGLG